MTMPEPLTVRLVSSYLGAYARHLRTYGHVTAWIGTPTRDQAESVLLDLAAELGVEPEQLSIAYLGDEFVTSSVIYRLVKQGRGPGVTGIQREAICHARCAGLQSPRDLGLPDHAAAPSSSRARVTPMSYGLLQRWRASARSLIVGGRDGLPRRTFRFADIERGWRVQDSDETSLGTVVSSGEILLTLSRGLLSSTLYLPPSAVAEVHEGVVRLNVTSRWVEAQGWDRAGSRK